MASKFIGLTRQLGWDQFTGTPTPQELQKMQQVAAGASGTVGMAAVKSSFKVHFGGKNPDEPVLIPAPGGSGFSLGDDVVVTAIFDQTGSWKRIDPLTTKGEELLLDHERGHYDLTALMARDCFIDLMQLKAKTFSSQADGQAAAKDIVKSYRDKLEKIQKKYDDDTIHGAWVTPMMGPERKETFQTKWEMYITRARTEERNPAMIAPDGKFYKVRILDVLANGGFIF
jgi:hypothetical protein